MTESVIDGRPSHRVADVLHKRPRESGSPTGVSRAPPSISTSGSAAELRGPCLFLTPPLRTATCHLPLVAGYASIRDGMCPRTDQNHGSKGPEPHRGREVAVPAVDRHRIAGSSTILRPPSSPSTPAWLVGVALQMPRPGSSVTPNMIRLLLSPVWDDSCSLRPSRAMLPREQGSQLTTRTCAGISRRVGGRRYALGSLGAAPRWPCSSSVPYSPTRTPPFSSSVEAARQDVVCR